MVSVAMNDRALARLFLSENDNFRFVYDASTDGHIAAWKGSRWAVSPSRRLLEEALFEWCEAVYAEAPAPNPNEKTDPYKRLNQTDHLAGLSRAVQMLMPKMRMAQFDNDDYLLAVDGGRTVDLRTGEMRESSREDYLSKRIYFAPADSPTPRFDRFMDEITCGRVVLKEFLLRLMALCLTGKAEQILVFLYGSGANGKGVFVRLIEKLLGPQYAYTLRPEELSDGRYNDEQMKRTFAQIEGARVVVVNEMRGDRLNLGMLKTLSGGDTLNGAKMGRDARPIRPTWKLLFTTNQMPEVPTKSAFITRVKLVPFDAVFERNGIAGAALEVELEAELPGILARLVKLCPDVLANGLQAPPEVEAATRELFEETDYLARFREEKLTDGGFITRADLVDSTAEWTRRNRLPHSVAKDIQEQLKHADGVTYHNRKRIDGSEPRALYEGVSLLTAPAVSVGAKLST